MTFRFLIAEGIGSVRRLAVASLVGSILTGVALAILGGTGLLALAYRTDLDHARAFVGAEVFLSDWVDESKALEISRELEAFPEIESARPREQSEILQLLGLDSPPAIPLPRLIRVELAGELAAPEGAASTTQRMAQRVEHISGVDEIAFPDTLVRTVDQRSDLFFRVVIIVGAALALSVIGIVANTAHATVLARRPVIRTMRLLGAERRWIVAPFLIQGSLIGWMGGLLAGAAIFATWHLFPGLETYFDEQQFMLLLLSFPLVGAILACIGALTASLYYVRKVA